MVENLLKEHKISLFLRFVNTNCMEGMIMTVKEKLQFFSNNGMSVSFIARQIGINPSTLSKWLRNEKGITHKNEDLIYETLQKIAIDFAKILEE